MDHLAGVDPLVERADLLGFVDHQLDGLVRGESRVVVIEGGLGTGKSALLREISHRTGPKVTPLVARCAPDEVDDELGAVRQLLEPLANFPAAGKPDGGDLDWLRNLDQGWFDQVVSAQGDDVRALYWLTVQIAIRKPLALIIDDVQWIDARSLDFLAYLLRRLHQTSILLVAGLDQQEPSPRWPRLALMVRDPSAVLWHLPPLSIAGVGTLCERTLRSADEDVVRTCHELTGGVPLLVSELLAEAARIRAGNGRPGNGGAGDGSGGDSGAGNGTAGNGGAGNGGAGNGGAGNGGAGNGHEASGETGGRVGGAQLSCADPAAGRDGNGADDNAALIEAFHRCTAPTIAAVALGRARRHGPAVVDVLNLLSVIETPLTMRFVAHAADRSEAQVADAVQTLRRLSLVTVDHRVMIDPPLLRAAVRSALSPSERHDTEARVACAVVAEGGHSEAAARYLMEAYPGGVPEHVGARAAVAVRALDGALAARPMGPVLDDMTTALNGWVVAGGDSSTELLLGGLVLIWADDLDAAHQFLTEVHVKSLKRGAVRCASLTAWMQALVEARRGHLDVAEDHVAQAGDLVDQRWRRGWRFLPMIVAAELAPDRGTTTELLAEAARAGLAGDLPAALLAHVGLARRGWLRVLSGDVRRGLDDLREAGRRLVEIGCVNPAVTPWRSEAAMALRRLGLDDQGYPLADEEVRLARQWASPRPLAIALRRRGLLCPEEDGDADLNESLRLLDGCGMPLEKARTLLALGRVRRLRRDFPQARAFLTEARALALTSGAHGLLAGINDELVMARGRPRLRPDNHGTPLTAGEERVARLAVTGKTNNQIARELFVARRTVEVHLTSVYRKLNIRGRVELPGALSALAEHSSCRDGAPEVGAGR